MFPLSYPLKGLFFTELLLSLIHINSMLTQEDMSQQSSSGVVINLIRRKKRGDAILGKGFPLKTKNEMHCVADGK